jgi:putative heme-binding domain-containing protein
MACRSVRSVAAGFIGEPPRGVLALRSRATEAAPLWPAVAVVAGAIWCALACRPAIAQRLTPFEHAGTKAADALAPGKRVAWTTSRVTGSPDPPPPYQVERVFGQLGFQNPVDLVDAPHSDRLFVVELRGKIFSIDNRPEADDARPELFVDLPAAIDGVKMAYGLTFHPNFPKTPYCYICYVMGDGLDDGTRVSRFEVGRADPPRVVPSSETILFTFRSGGHNGGCLKFGPDGYLYISTGDAEAPFPPDGRRTGQDISDLLSSVLRIDVNRPSGERPYTVPADNPFLQLAGARPEVWAYGFRNPWKMSFDRATGDLWVGDVGWELLEMVYRVERGGNYGWAVMEGSQPVLAEVEPGPTPISPPVIEHAHTEARSITGGYVYHGARLPDLQGAYIYGDFETGKVWALRHDGQRVVWRRELVDTTLKIVSFGEDRDGEIYLLDHEGGIYRLTPNDQAESNLQFPRLLSQTGLFDSVERLAAAPGVVAYEINAEPWMDGAVAQRHLALPGTSSIDTSAGAWRFPPETVLAKTISLETERGRPATTKRLETQLLHFDGRDWRGYSYVWNDEQTDAALADAEGAERTLTIIDAEAPGGRRQQNWRIHGRVQCLVCHNTWAGSVLSFTPAQLAGPDRADTNQETRVAALNRAGILKPPVTESLPRLVSGEALDRDGSAQRDSSALEPFANDPSTIDFAALEAQARSYLHVNCAHCHRRHAGGTAAIELPWELPLDQTRALRARPTQGAFGIHHAEVIAPGEPYRSVLFYRVSKSGRAHMPQFGADRIDRRAVRLLHEWIARMPAGQSAADQPAAGAAQSSDVRRLLAELVDSPPVSAGATIDRLLATTSGALALMWAIDQRQLDGPTREAAVRAGISHGDLQISGLFERFVPDDARPKRLGSVVRPAEILSLTGSAAAGRRLFETGAIECKACHRSGNIGTEIGPDLTQIGTKLDRAQLLEAVLEPSKRVDAKYRTYLLETSDGQVHTGLLVEKTERETVLRTTQNKLIRVPAEEVELLTAQQKSLMPELLLRDMTPQQVADVLAFLGESR